MPSVLVLGDGRRRGAVAEALAGRPELDVVDCDPALGDCVMYARLEGARFDAFLFLAWDHPVTRGALAAVAERSVLLPLVERDADRPDPLYDGYLFRLPRALGFRDAEERDALVAAVPKAATVPSELVGPELDPSRLAQLVGLASRGRWQWSDLVERAAAEAGRT